MCDLKLYNAQKGKLECYEILFKNFHIYIMYMVNYFFSNDRVVFLSFYFVTCFIR